MYMYMSVYDKMSNKCVTVGCLAPDQILEKRRQMSRNCLQIDVYCVEMINIHIRDLIETQERGLGYLKCILRNCYQIVVLAPELSPFS